MNDLPRLLNGNIMWLLPDGVLTKRMKAVTSFMKQNRIQLASVRYDSIHSRVKGIWVKKPKTKATKWINPNKRPMAEALWPQMLELHKPTVIVINCIATGKLLFPDIFRNTTLSAYRGSVYYDAQLAVDDNGHAIPFIVIDDLFKTYQPRFIPEGETKASANPDLQRWIAKQDFGRMARYLRGQENGRAAGHTINFALKREDLFAVYNTLGNVLALSCDIETTRKLINCIGFSGLMPDGTTKTWVIPFYNPVKEFGCHWKDVEDEQLGWQVVKKLLEETEMPVFMANGTYDCTYLLKYDIIPKHLLIDTVVMMHSLFPECRKSLAMSASITNDDYYYWKDDVKGNKEDFDKAGYIPTTYGGLLHHWNYNGMDCYHTLWAGIRLLKELVNTPWALVNYENRMKLQYGPAMSMSMHGFKLNRSFYDRRIHELKNKSYKGLRDLKLAVGLTDFNPNSPPQKAALFYDLLGCPIPSLAKKRSTQEQYLRQLASVHPFHRLWFDKLLAYSKPNKQYTEYSRLQFAGSRASDNERLLSGFSAIGTWTTRFNSSNHNFWMGRNMQNIPAGMRPMLQADDGFILWDADYSQSDAYFVAFESQDPAYIKNMLDDRDTHAVHTEFFLGVNYDEVMRGKRSNDPYIVDPVTGARQITKKVVHGLNYDMEAWTMLLTVGREAMNAAAEKLMPNCGAALWSQDKMLYFVKQLSKKYNLLYPELSRWKTQLAKDVANNQNRIVNAFGMTHRFFGNPLTDQSIKRQLSAFKGQSGTAGNINRSLLELYNSEEYRVGGGELIMQCHDSIVGQVPITNLSLLDNVLTIMEKEVTINTRTFKVPAELDLAMVWGKKAVSYRGLNDKWTQERYINEANQLALEYR